MQLICQNLSFIFSVGLNHPLYLCLLFPHTIRGFRGYLCSLSQALFIFAFILVCFLSAGHSVKLHPMFESNQINNAAAWVAPRVGVLRGVDFPSLIPPPGQWWLVYNLFAHTVYPMSMNPDDGGCIQIPELLMRSFSVTSSIQFCDNCTGLRCMFFGLETLEKLKLEQISSRLTWNLWSWNDLTQSSVLQSECCHPLLPLIF